MCKSVRKMWILSNINALWEQDTGTNCWCNVIMFYVGNKRYCIVLYCKLYVPLFGVTQSNVDLRYYVISCQIVI